jgi:hypothetical protein
LATAEWYRVCLPWAVIAIIARDGMVTAASPIARWTADHKLTDVLAYYEYQGAEIARLP